MIIYKRKELFKDLLRSYEVPHLREEQMEKIIKIGKQWMRSFLPAQTPLYQLLKSQTCVIYTLFMGDANGCNFIVYL